MNSALFDGPYFRCLKQLGRPVSKFLTKLRAQEEPPNLQFTYAHRRRRGGCREGSPQLSRNLLHSGNFPERTIGHMGSFSDFALLIRAEVLHPPLPKFLVLLRLCLCANIYIYVQKYTYLVSGSRLSKLLNCIIEDQNSLLPDTSIIPNGD